MGGELPPSAASSSAGQVPRPAALSTHFGHTRIIRTRVKRAIGPDLEF
jgi:hypothetical protein